MKGSKRYIVISGRSLGSNVPQAWHVVDKRTRNSVAWFTGKGAKAKAKNYATMLNEELKKAAQKIY